MAQATAIIPWCAIGDFNSITSASEKLSLRPSRLILDFQQLMISSGLQDMGYSSNKYTWSNNRRAGYVAARLDRALCNHLWQAASSDPLVTYLPKYSDHCPLLLSNNQMLPSAGAPFKFEAMWLHHPEFLSLVAENWNLELAGNPQ